MIALVSEMDVQQRIVPWPYGFCDEGHSGICRDTATFFYVALHTGTNDIAPDGFSTEASWNNVVE